MARAWPDEPSAPVAPVVTAFIARRASLATPVVRSEEGLTVGFSERIDPRGAVPANFSIVGDTAVYKTLVQRLEGVSGVQVRAADAVGNPLALPAGDYALVIDNLRDLATPANLMAHTSLAFTVAPLTGRPVELLATSIALYLSSAMLSRVAMNLVPM